VIIEWMPAYNASDGRTLLRSLKERQVAIDAAKGRIAALQDGLVKTTAKASLLMMPYGVDDYESVLKECIRIVSSSAEQVVEDTRLTAVA
jgi:hypothetical protein